MRPNDKIQGYSGKVSFENTKRLIEAGLVLIRPFKAGWDYNQEGGYASAVDLEYNGKVFKAPTYGEAFDFLGTKGVAIGMNPCFTFAIKGHIAYGYTVGVVNEESAEMNYDNDSEYGSFNLEAEAAITCALGMLNSNSNLKGIPIDQKKLPSDEKPIMVTLSTTQQRYLCELVCQEIDSTRLDLSEKERLMHNKDAAVLQAHIGFLEETLNTLKV